MLFDVTAHGLDHLELTIAINRSRTAPQAGSIAGLFSLVGLAEKLDVLAPRSFGGARGPAVHTGGRDGKDELTVVGCIPPRNRFPPALVKICHL